MNPTKPTQIMSAEATSAEDLRVTNGRTRFALVSDRAGGRPVEIELSSGCDTRGATSSTPRAPGVATSVRLRSISPRYAGTVFDQFAGGCVSSRFDFLRGPHIALIEEFRAAVGLYSRQELGNGRAVMACSMSDCAWSIRSRILSHNLAPDIGTALLS